MCSRFSVIEGCGFYFYVTDVETDNIILDFIMLWVLRFATCLSFFFFHSMGIET